MKIKFIEDDLYYGTVTETYCAIYKRYKIPFMLQWECWDNGVNDPDEEEPEDFDDQMTLIVHSSIKPQELLRQLKIKDRVFRRKLNDVKWFELRDNGLEPIFR